MSLLSDLTRALAELKRAAKNAQRMVRRARKHLKPFIEAEANARQTRLSQECNDAIAKDAGCCEIHQRNDYDFLSD